MRRTLGALAGVLLLVLASGGRPAAAQKTPHALLDGAVAYVVGDPVRLAGPRITRILPSPDSPFVLLVREPTADVLPGTPAAPGRPAEALQILLWNAKTGRVTVVWEHRGDGRMGARIVEMNWLARSSSALAMVARSPLGGAAAGSPRGTLAEREIVVIDTRKAQARVVPAPARGPLIFLRDQPFALHYVGESDPANTGFRDQAIRVVRPDGSMSTPVPLPADTTPRFTVSADGTKLHVEKMVARSTRSAPARFALFGVDLRDGAVTPLTDDPEAAMGDTGDLLAEKVERLPYRLAAREVEWKGAPPPGDRMTAAYLEQIGAAPAPGALVAADAEPLGLTHDGAAALFRARGGSVYAASIVRRASAEYLAARRAEQQETTVMRAKQLGMALLQYLQQHDERFPPAGMDVRPLLRPYLGDPDTMFRNPATDSDGFTFFHPGVENHSEMKAIEKTPLAHLAGPGGRAVVYGDGHVDWEDAP